ncbi:GAF domain protein [Synechococcus sp. PCC 7335]|uniref:GAF domain-containing protein n=1 Tax=Synechococcus sp. (strain ATCC 29403 / PCC 7335) TaxID=91464 RepID=UPI00017EE0D1|nr:GAF domain-containing protein [Synechococcus sp. PCC 7335]EDX83772.1 GAF domain protein [Synechococcus sp. PCC 7335]
MVTKIQHNQQPTEQQALSFQNKLLNGVAEAARRLLAVENFDQAVDGALGAIAHAANIDHIAVYEHHARSRSQSQNESSTCPYEWPVVKLKEIQETSAQFCEFYDDIAGSKEWLAELQAGCSVQKLIRRKSKSEQSNQEGENTLLVLRIPIFVGETYWGSFEFDNCMSEKIWDEAEIAMLQIAVAFIGSAIVRERAHSAREAVATGRTTTLATYNQELHAHDRLLRCVNTVTQCLIANDDLALAFPATLQIIGESIHQCRVYILRNSHHSDTGELLFNLHAEWKLPSVPRKITSGAKFPVSVSAFPDRLSASLKAGQAIQFFARELDGIASEDRPVGQAKSLLGIPINVAGVWWGLLGFDDCNEERVWADAEVAILETAATAIGNSIERDRTRRAREAVEREMLIVRERVARTAELEAANASLSACDRWLEITAVANELLSVTDIATSVDSALAIIGENLECDRLLIMRYLSTNDSHPLGAMQSLYEWDAPDIRSQIDRLGPSTISAEGLEERFLKFLAGQSVSSGATDFSEPMWPAQKQLEIKSTYSVPVFVEGALWGIVAIDYCHKTKQLSLAELSVFKTAATCLGSAIYHANM